MAADGVAAAPLGRRRGIPLWWHAVILAVSLVVATAIAWMTAAPRFTFLPGTDLGGDAAPTFRLTDHRGVSIGLEDFRGRPVVLAFLYSNCPDVCRLTGAGLRQTLEQLGPDAKNVQLLAVTVDPSGDDAASVRRFLGRYNLTDRLLYLTGPANSLPTVWQDYHLFVNVEGGQPKQAQLDAHTDALFVLDKQGRERTLLRSDFDPDELATGLRALIAE